MWCTWSPDWLSCGPYPSQNYGIHVKRGQNQLRSPAPHHLVQGKTNWSAPRRLHRLPRGDGPHCGVAACSHRLPGCRQHSTWEGMGGALGFKTAGCGGPGWGCASTHARRRQTHMPTPRRCICVCMYVCMYVCIYIYTQFKFIYVFIYVAISLAVYLDIHTSIYVRWLM